MQEQYMYPVSTIINQVQQILKSFKQSPTQILVKIFKIIKSQTQIQIYLIQLHTISSTLILSQNWPRELFKSQKNKEIVFAFRADIQTHGRGQRENQWVSPQGNLYMTILFKLTFDYFSYLPIISISSLFNVIREQLMQNGKKKQVMKIKWINDILIDFEKVSGVLIKNQVIGQSLYTHIGIGVNVKCIPTGVLNQPVTFLESFTQKQIEISQFYKKILAKLVDNLLVQDLNVRKIQQKQNYEKNIAYLNREVVIWDYKFEKILGSGKFKAVNQYGHAIIQGYESPFIEGRMKPQEKIY